jgi:hypothetical protein
VKQVLGENGGPGGLFHAMRNIPIVLDICRDIERLAPDALVLNYTNPEGRICLAANRYTDLQFVGLCHGIGIAQDTISQVTGIPADDIDPKAGGLNHFNWILDLRRKSTGEDIYPLFKQAIAEKGVEHIGLDGWGFGVKLSRYLMNVYGLRCLGRPRREHLSTRGARRPHGYDSPPPTAAAEPTRAARNARRRWTYPKRRRGDRDPHHHRRAGQHAPARAGGERAQQGADPQPAGVGYREVPAIDATGPTAPVGPPEPRGAGPDRRD